MLNTSSLNLIPKDSVVVDKLWGTEIWWENTDKVCMKILEINPGFRCSLHFHRVKEETFIVIEGEVLLEYQGKTLVMWPGDRQLIKPFETHRFGATVPSRIVEISTHHDDDDTVRLEGSAPLE